MTTGKGPANSPDALTAMPGRESPAPRGTSRLRDRSSSSAPRRDTLLAVYADGPVSFEADHLDPAHRDGWSVLVQGHARTVTDEREVKRLEDRTHLEPWAGDAHDVYVRITPARISGRCIEPGWASPLAPDTKAQALCPEPVATGSIHRRHHAD